MAVPRNDNEPAKAMKGVLVTRDIVVTVNSPALSSVPDDEWARYCDVCETMQRGLDEGEVGSVIVFSDLSAPNARQRKQVAEVGAIRPHKAVMVSSSAFLRGVVTALNWLGVNMKAFPPDEWRRALAECGITSSDRIEAVARAAFACEAAFGKRLESLKPLRNELGAT